MGVGAADQHAVLLHQAEARGRLAGAGQGALVAGAAQVDQQPAAHARDAGAAGENVEGNALALENAPGGPAHGRQGRLAAAVALDVGALADVPLDGASALGEDLVEEGHAGQDARRLAPEGCRARVVADHEAAHIKGGSVLGQPGRDLRLPRDGEEVLQRAVVDG